MDDAQARFSEAVALHRSGDFAGAEARYRQLVALRPDIVEAHNNLGAVLQAQGRFEAAIAAHRAALALRPGSLEAQLNLAAALHRLGRLEEAVACYAAALALAPGHAAANANLGLLLQAQGRLGEALAHHQSAVAAQPGNAEFQNNLGLCWQDLGDIAAAKAAFERAIALRPDFAEARLDLGIALLLEGDLVRGWPLYDWRLARRGVAQPNRPGPRWDGGDLSGRTLILQSDQGLGDAIQCIRYAPMAAARGARVIVSCRPPLARLFRGVAGVDDPAASPAFDCWAPMLSLPRLFGANLDTIPSADGYLRADPALADAWRGRLARRRGLKVGLAWRGSPEHLNDRNRSITAARLAGLVDMKGLALVSLQ